MRSRVVVCLVLAAVAGVLTLTPASVGTTRLGGRVVYWSQTPWPSIWALRPGEVRDQRILHNRQNAKRPRLSPDRAWVAFDGTPPGKPVLSDFDIQVVRLDGSELHTLTSSPEWDTDAHWSPDGRWLTFTRSPPSPVDCSGSSIWIMRSDGSEQRPLIPGCGARWSRDGANLAYTSPDGHDLFVVDVRSASSRRLLATRAEAVQAAGWSLDGTRILFSRQFDRYGRRADIVVVNADGTGVRKLADGLAGSWSPNGSRILYTRSFFSPLFVMRADGSHKRRISRWSASEPDWR